MAYDVEQRTETTATTTLSKVLALFVLALGAFALMAGLDMMFSGAQFPAVVVGAVGLILAVVGGSQYRAALN